MFKLIKIIIGIVVFLVIAVIAFAITILVLNRGNKAKAKTTTPSYSLGELNTLTVNVDVKDSYVIVKKSNNGKVNFNYYDSKTRTFETATETDLLGNVTLTLKGYQMGKWYNRIFLSLKGTKIYGITVEVPDDCFVNVKTNNGNIRYEGVYCSTLSADTTNGGVFFKNVDAKVVDANTVNGNIEIESTKVTDSFTCRTRKGNVKLNHLVASSLLLSVIDITTDDGNINVDNSYVENDNLLSYFNLYSGKGNIEGTIRYKVENHYRIKAKANNGTCNLTDTSIGLVGLNVTTDNGNINLELRPA